MSFNPGNSSAVDDKNLFVPQDSKRVHVETEQTDQIQAAVYTMIDEDDGVGQLLRHELQRDPRVSFAAYRIPHRQEALMKLRFHVASTLNPAEVLNDALCRCIARIEAVHAALSTAAPTAGA